MGISTAVYDLAFKVCPVLDLRMNIMPDTLEALLFDHMGV